MDGTFILHLIRHAPTLGNQEKQYIGWTDEPVVPFKASAFSEVAEVWGSDLQRCRQTAKVLFPNASYHADANWRECHFGEWEQKTYSQLKGMEAYRNWLDDPFHCMPPGGESLKALAERVERAVLALPDKHEFMIVTHGGPIRYLAGRAKKEEFWEQQALHGYRYTLVSAKPASFRGGTTMHIVFGGAFNGKRQYVKEKLENQPVSWFEAAMPRSAATFTVVAGVEKWVKLQLEKGWSEDEILQAAKAALLLNESGRQLWVLTDINRGIVPLHPIERQQRDVVGRLYQFLFKQAESITRIWYGIPEIIKGADKHENLYKDR